MLPFKKDKMKVKALENFVDGNIFAAHIEAGQVVEVSRREYELLVQSGGKFEVVPDDTEVTPVEVFMPREVLGNPLLTKEQFEAKQLKDKQEFDAKQKAEKDAYDAAGKVKQPEFVLNLTNPEGTEQATKEAEVKAEKKVAEKKNKEQQAAIDQASKEVQSEQPQTQKNTQKTVSGHAPK